MPAPRLFVLLAALTLCVPRARAAEVVYGPDGAPTVVQHKLYEMTGKWEAGLSFVTALNTSLVDQTGGLLSVSYHPNESLDLGVDLLGQKTGLSTLAQNVRGDLQARQAGRRGDEFANDNQLRAAGLFTARLAPIYGKFNLASELSVHFQAFLLASAGVGSMHRESVNLCGTPGTAVCQQFQTSDSVKPLGVLGGGFRFYFSQRWSVRTELRGILFAASYTQGADLTQPGTGTPANYLGTILALDAGVSAVF